MSIMHWKLLRDCRSWVWTTPVAGTSSSVTDKWLNFLQEDHETGTVLDVSKTCDTVWQKSLVTKLCPRLMTGYGKKKKKKSVTMYRTEMGSLLVLLSTGSSILNTVLCCSSLGTQDLHTCSISSHWPTELLCVTMV